MFNKIVNYFSDVRSEMTKVTWPSRPEVIESTWIVLGLTLLFGVAVFAVDRLLSLGLQQLL
ncbi:MAG: preprotein translocase subunit SecE [Calditrichaeota bacterium]|nr:preprotein translocase subunit SecE [Calditrichota bacterium]MCB9368600.1 preprotein translocase subunit SecE [Calditrichota bacterium]